MAGVRNSDILEPKGDDAPILNELEEKAKFDRRIGLFKEFCCQKLEPFFE